MSGIGDLVSAFAGRNVTANDSYNKELARLTAAKSAQALMDKRVAEAAMSKTQNAQFQNIPNLEGIDPRMAALIQSDTADQWSAGQQGIGREQMNDLTAQAMEVVKMLKEGGADPVTVLNSINAAKGDLLGPTNVRTADQADATIAKTQGATQNAAALNQAQIAAQAANVFASTQLGGKRMAETNKVNEEIQNLQDQGLEVPDENTLEMMFPPVIYDDGTQDQNPDMSQFLRWYHNAATTDPELRNLMAAYSEFKKRKSLAPSSALINDEPTATKPKPARQELYQPNDYTGYTDEELLQLMRQRGIQ